MHERMQGLCWAGWLAMAALAAASLLTGCSGMTVSDPGYFTAITAAANSIRVNQTMQMENHAAITKVALSFYVNGIEGGNEQIGTIDANGLYTAPAVVPTPNTVVITTTAAGHPEYPQGTVTLAVLNPIPVITTVAPTALTEGTSLVTVTGSQFVYGATIVWNGSAVATTYLSSTQLAAAIDAPNPGTFPLLVTNPDPGSANSASLPVLVQAGAVKLKLDTSGGTTVRVRNSISFGLTVTGTNNTAVNVLVNGIAGGNAQIGTATASTSGVITYTAPAIVPTPSNVVQLTVVSVDDPTVSLSQNIAVLNPIPVLTAVTPNDIAIGSTAVTLTGSDFIAGAQVLVDGAAIATTFVSGTQLTATLAPTQAGTLDVQVLNPDPGAATSAIVPVTVAGTAPTPTVSAIDAARFLDQATFGATDDGIHHLSKIGYAAWFNEQFSTPQSELEPGVEQALILNNPACAGGDTTCNAKLFLQSFTGQQYVENGFWQQSLTAPDELRQRVAYSLQEMLVISMASTGVEFMPRGAARYYDVLGADAFGNFRQLLEDVTLNPMMGQWLAMQGNDKGNANTDPDENYAREVMQLFTIGLWQLNDDGSQKLGTTGQPIPTYSNTDVQGLAKVFTGWSWNIPGDTSGAGWSNCCAYVGTGYGEDLLPLTSYPEHHSTAEKDFLGVTIGASTTPDTAGDLKIALDTLFNHPNTPAFVSKQLIQHLVTSNPSPAYISRVAAVFKDNGSGVRGDMKAVLQAILLDTEARDAAAAQANPQFGKVREALIRYTEWARAFTAQSRNGSFNIGSTEDPIWGLGQMALAATPDALMDRLNLLLMAGQMDATLRGQIEGAVSAIPIPTGDQDAINAALLARVRTAIYLTMASPAYAAQI